QRYPATIPANQAYSSPPIQRNATQTAIAITAVTVGGITSRSRSQGYSWWMQWMRKDASRCSSEREEGWKWQTQRCSRYARNVQENTPAATQPATAKG